jgi:hypothetical protein
MTCLLGPSSRGCVQACGLQWKGGGGWRYQGSSRRAGAAGGTPAPHAPCAAAAARSCPQALSARLFDCRPQDLANLLVSCALLRLPPGQETRSALLAALRATGRRFGPRE